jgi:alcohol dehydrogenase
MMRSKAMVLKAPLQLEMAEFALPEVGEDDGILKLELIGVCGSDPGIYKGKTRGAPRPYPIILGHEIVGRIEKMGKTAKKRHNVREGDRVIIEYAFGCGNCQPCLSGNYILCEKKYTYGSMISCKEPPHLFGAYSEYLYIHPRAMIHKIPDSISRETGVLISAVLGNGVRWLNTVGNLRLGNAVVIIGPGSQGLAGVIAAKESGAGPIIVIGLSHDAKRLEMAQKFGAHVIVLADKQDCVKQVYDATRGKMADLVMDATGNPAGAVLSLDLAGNGATIVLPGLYGPETKIPLVLDKAILKELKLVGVFSHNFPAVETAIAIAEKKLYPLEEMISHRFPLHQAKEAVELVGGFNNQELPLKVVLDPNME